MIISHATGDLRKKKLNSKLSHRLLLFFFSTENYSIFGVFCTSRIVCIQYAFPYIYVGSQIYQVRICFPSHLCILGRIINCVNFELTVFYDLLYHVIISKLQREKRISHTAFIQCFTYQKNKSLFVFLIRMEILL